MPGLPPDSSTTIGWPIGKSSGRVLSPKNGRSRQPNSNAAGGPCADGTTRRKWQGPDRTTPAVSLVGHSLREGKMKQVGECHGANRRDEAFKQGVQERDSPNVPKHVEGETINHGIEARRSERQSSNGPPPTKYSPCPAGGQCPRHGERQCTALSPDDEPENHATVTSRASELAKAVRTNSKTHT